MAKVPEAYLGVWQRLLLRTPQLEDTTTDVYWLQTHDWHGDIRIPANRPNCAGKTALTQLDYPELLGLSRQQGFAGVTEVAGDICRWHRKVDFQPRSGFNDVGRMVFESANRVLEYGVEQDYFEIWQRLPDSLANPWTDIRHADDVESTPSLIRLGIGNYIMQVRPRTMAAPPPTDAKDLEGLRRWVDFEISFGTRTTDGTKRIFHSTLPWLEGMAPI